MIRAQSFLLFNEIASHLYLSIILVFLLRLIYKGNREKCYSNRNITTLRASNIFSFKHIQVEYPRHYIRVSDKKASRLSRLFGIYRLPSPPYAILYANRKVQPIAKKR